ncbi:MAG TPA: polysaccharide deacetylase family protein [Bryobacteraceae bacterium]|nr:polysaccharide deacetylase family protein [Bryobacteraceae bacterium]
MHSDRILRVVMYHYVRDLPRTPFPRLKGMLLDDFRQQVTALGAQFEMASIESAMDFLSGEYRPRRDLCLLTFDDGLKEHYRDVAPFLAEKRIRGAFFLITSAVDERRLAAVHMNHFLLAKLPFEEYADAFFRKALALAPDGFTPLTADTARAAQTYPWDPPEVARFKYVFNFGMDPDLRDRAVRDLFTTHISDEASFADSLYVTWDEARRMQKMGMSIGGHTHQHKPLANLSPGELNWDLETCHRLLHQHLAPQAVWAFSYPYGKKDSFHIRAVRKLQQLNFRCGFSTEVSDNRRGSDAYTIGRTDCKKALVATAGV